MCALKLPPPLPTLISPPLPFFADVAYSEPVELTPSSPYAYTSLSPPPPPLPFFVGVAYSETVELTPSSPYAYTPSTLHPLPIFAGVVYSGAIGQPSPQFRFPVSICLPSPSILSLASVLLLCSLHPGLLPLPNPAPPLPVPILQNQCLLSHPPSLHISSIYGLLHPPPPPLPFT